MPALMEFGAYHAAIDSMGAAGDAAKLERALGAGLPTLARKLADVMCVREIRSLGRPMRLDVTPGIRRCT